MSPDVRVTVLLAVYNGGHYLLEAVDSVLAQTFRDFELLLVDDASTDGGVERLTDDPRIRVLRNERNIGQIPSLNRGLREARGEYVARLDHDDVCLPRRLEAQLELLDSHPEIALAGAWVDIVDTAGRVWTPVRPSVRSFAEFAAQVVTGHVHFVHPSITFRRDVVVGLGGFDESLNAAEDHDLYRKLVLAGCDARIVPETLLRYRRHEQQMTIAKSTAVWESDARSYDRFVAALAPQLPAATVRMLLRNDPRFWSQPPLAPDGLELFLDGAATTLKLNGEDRSVLERALARSAAATLLSGWTGDAEPAAYGTRAPTLGDFARRHGDGRSRSVGALAPLLASTASAGTHLGAARSVLTNALRSEALASVRRTARNSRLLRRVYARVADTRAHDY